MVELHPVLLARVGDRVFVKWYVPRATISKALEAGDPSDVLYVDTALLRIELSICADLAEAEAAFETERELFDLALSRPGGAA